MAARISKLVDHESEIRSRRQAGRSYRAIAAWLKDHHGIDVSHNAVYSFVKVRERRDRRPTVFWEGLPRDVKDALLHQLSVLWTHDSTAIEGNTLTLGETARVLELGLTISGKPLKDHEEVYGHARAIDLIMDLLKTEKLERENIFNLHRCVMRKSPVDSLRPVGNWKREYNGTTGVQEGRPVYMEYASPDDTPQLMTRWLREFNRKLASAGTPARAINVYAWIHMTFARIHPFFDGNGRLARLLGNLPLLKSGWPPLLIAPENRVQYLDCLWNYQTAVGVIKGRGSLLPPHPELQTFKWFLKNEWQASFELVEGAREQAKLREERDEGGKRKS